MAIKIECAECGFKNDLGRVFCTSCGMKLDLKRTSSSDLEDRREIAWGRIIGKGIGILVLVGMIGAIALACWPGAPSVVQRDAAGGQQVALKTRAVKKALSARQRASVDYSESEINGFLAGRAESRKLKALTMNIQPGAMELGAWFSWRPGVVTNMTWLPKNKVALPVSIEMTATFSGGTLVVKSGRIGHLPLVGPLLGIPKRYFGDVFSDILAEQQMVEMLANVVFDQDMVRIKFGK